MSRAQVLAFADVLSAGEADQVQLDTYYTEAVRELGHTTDHITNLSLVTGVEDQAVYEAPSQAVRILACFYGQRQLYPETYTGLASAAGPFWRALHGDPVGYTTVDTSDRSVRLFPVPNRAGESYVPLSGLFGAAYPDYNVFLAHTEERADAPDYLDLYLTFTILAREFARDSAHQDYTFSEACSMLASVALAAVS